MKRAIPCVGIGFAGCAAFTVGLLHVMKIGTCASGGPFVTAQPCPSDAGTWTLLLAGGIVAAVIAIIIGGWGGAGLLVWCVLFLSSGIGMLIYALTAGNVSSGAKTAGYVIGATFIPMGGLPLIYLIASWIRGTELRRLKARSKEADATVSRVEELQRYGFNQARIRVTYAVSPLDDASFEVSRETNTLLSQLPRAGQRVRVSYDPRNRNRFEVVSANAAVAPRGGAVARSA
jgi:hypothetical protein